MPSYYKDMTGEVFSRLTVIEEAGRTPQKQVLWKCACSCGNYTIVSSTSLRSGNTKSCGCLNKEALQKRATNIVGQKFSRLLVLEQIGTSRPFFCRCLCDCGNEVVVAKSNLVTGNTKSCGCFNLEVASARFATHRLSSFPEYNVYKDMMRRCYNPNFKHFNTWGGRGIVVCDEWRGNPKAFVEWARQFGYAPGLSLDRIDNDGSYSPENCRWVTAKEQHNNRSNNARVTFKDGQSMTVTQCSEKYGIPTSTLRHRLAQGLDAEDAISMKKFSRIK